MSHWILNQRGKYIDVVCSKCGYVRVKEFAYNYRISQIDKEEFKEFITNNNMNYCENCGEKMETSKE